jgi:hypothetical protein
VRSFGHPQATTNPQVLAAKSGVIADVQHYGLAEYLGAGRLVVIEDPNVQEQGRDRSSAVEHAGAR